jgi:hypothetical protein
MSETMNLSGLLRKQTEDVYKAVDGLATLVNDADLDWKPETGPNWMTTGQLLCHLQMACGLIAQCFVTGDWSALEKFETDESQRDPETGMLPASAMPSVASVAAFREALAADRAAMLGAIDAAGEERLSSEPSAAPWDPTPRALAYSLQECLLHVGIHRAQLFYYLKLQGRDVNTAHMWGMDMPAEGDG